jgi:hypothetical protein
MVQKSQSKTMVYSHRYKPEPPKTLTTTLMVLQMISKENPAEILPRVTWTIAPCSFTAIGAWMEDICCLSLIEFPHVWVPFSLIFPMLCQHMYRRSTAWTAWWRCCNDPIILYFVCHHFHCQFPSKSQCRIRFLVPRICTSLPSVHLCNQRKLTIGPPFYFPHGLQPYWIMAMIVHIIDPVLPLVVLAEVLCILEQFPFSVNTLPGRVTFYLIKSPM